MANTDQLLPESKEPFFPKGSAILLAAHVGVNIFFLVMYFLLHSNIETFKILMLVYYTLFSMFFLFFYHNHLRVRRIFIIWCVIGALQLIFYLINASNNLWQKWSFNNVLVTLTGLPIVLLLYYILRRESLKHDNKELVVGVRTLSDSTRLDIAATIGIPLVVLLVCWF